MDAALTPESWRALWLTLRLATVVTVVLVALSLPVAGWLARAQGRWVVFAEAILGLPLVLPPTVLGFYLLALFAPQTWLGRFWFEITGDTLAFSFSGLVLGSVIYSLPYTVQPVLAAFRAVPRGCLDASASLGARPWTTFRRIVVPMSWRGITVGAMLGFAHTVGEFGVVLMLGGSIPGRTRVASIALYDEVQRLHYPAAHFLALVLLAGSFVVLVGLGFIQRTTRLNHPNQ
jgi:molybdate transport system permease protein